MAHPNFSGRFPGGIIRFAQLAAQLPEDALEVLMTAEANGVCAPNPNRCMPGQLQGEIGVFDFEQDVADQAPAVGGAEWDSSDDGADIEVRGVSRLNGRFLRFAPVHHNSHSQ